MSVGFAALPRLKGLRRLLKSTPEKMLKELNDEQLHTATLVAADCLKSLRDEAVRRGLWEKWKKSKV